MREYVLHARPGWGSAIVEAQLAWYGLPMRIVDVGDLFDSAQARDTLRPLNPLTQIPVLVLPDAQVMTESAEAATRATRNRRRVPGRRRVTTGTPCDEGPDDGPNWRVASGAVNGCRGGPTDFDRLQREGPHR